MTPPAHHGPDGRFRNPWPVAAEDEALRKGIWRVAWEYVARDLPPDPDPSALPAAVPDLARPRAAEGDARLTWVGHATVLLQLPGLNVLTDPVWSDRSSPVGFAGPHRFVPAAPALGDLPPVDAVLLSHDHYDHLDRPTVRALHRRFGEAVAWYAPLGYRPWFRRQGIGRVVELDWWEEAELPGGRWRATCVPARHWTRRRPLGTNRRLWGGWVLAPADARGPGGGAPPDGAAGERRPAAAPRVYFAGDSGYCPAFAEIGARLGPFDASLLPVGAYEPRWFMGAAHLNPEEAVRAYADLGGRGAFVGIHWGTWRLTFEDPLEPPARTRAAWAAAGLPARDLHLPRHGETLTIARPGESI